MPVTGTSLRYTLRRRRTRRRRKTVQYFEMMGHRAIYADGWKAVTRHQAGHAVRRRRVGAVPRRRGPLRVPRPRRRASPSKLAELVELWWEEAEAHGVLPLDDRTIELFGARFRDRSPHRADRRYTLPPADDAAARPRSARRSAGGAGTCGATDRPARRRRRRPLRDRAPRTRGSASSSRATGWCSTTTASATTTSSSPIAPCRSGRPWSACGSAARGQGGRGHPGHRRRPSAGRSTCPFVMRMISSIGPSVGFDHGSPVSGRYTGAYPFEGHPAPASTSSC